MIYCKELFSLSVLSLYEGELLGTVNRLYFDKKLKKLMEIELVNDDGIKLIMPTKNIYNIGKNAITIKNNQQVNIKTESLDFVNCPIGCKAYSITGEYLGTINEICLSDKFTLEKFSLDNNNTLLSEDIATLGKNTIIFYNKNQRLNIKKFSPKETPEKLKTTKAEIVEFLPTIDNKNVVAIETKLQNTDFLIGRVCGKDIVNFNNEILVKNNAVITKKILKDVNRFGKLRELMLYLK